MEKVFIWSHEDFTHLDQNGEPLEFDSLLNAGIFTTKEAERWTKKNFGITFRPQPVFPQSNLDLRTALLLAEKTDGYAVRNQFAYKPYYVEYNGKKILKSDAFFLTEVDDDPMASEWDEEGFSEEEAAATDWQLLRELPSPIAEGKV